MLSFLGSVESYVIESQKSAAKTNGDRHMEIPTYLHIDITETAVWSGKGKWSNNWTSKNCVLMWNRNVLWI